ncbi:uncharacterized protein [Chelonus insularis]|uniref:uncharacterized protein n=1 Tax=Chelonus insularis TaxID=460826 RepID=UPI00158DA66D|nr:uncharacterized protein LOC118069009 [Chelonus insularis]XP_034942709.1 uncharacterized protein LOC118069009 [Chelonus insularis]
MIDNLLVNDFESIIQSIENEEALLQRLSTFMVESRSKLKSSIDDFQRILEKSRNQRRENIDVISQLQNHSKEIEKQIDEVLVFQKVSSKKISNSEKVEEKLKDDIKAEKRKREELMLEKVDLEQAREKQTKEKRIEWNALKKAMAAFKDNLNIHISYKEMDSYDQITVAYFFRDNQDRNNFYVIFNNYRNSTWKVQHVEPTLRDEHLKELKLDFSKIYDLHDIRKFVPAIRKTLLKYYYCNK